MTSYKTFKYNQLEFWTQRVKREKGRDYMCIPCNLDQGIFVILKLKISPVVFSFSSEKIKEVLKYGFRSTVINFYKLIVLWTKFKTN